MKYKVTILLEAGTYEEVNIDVPVDIEQTWEHFLTNKQVRLALNEYANYQVIDIDPDVDFKELVDYNRSGNDHGLPVDGSDDSQLLQLE